MYILLAVPRVETQGSKNKKESKHELNEEVFSVTHCALMGFLFHHDTQVTILAFH